MGKIKRSVLRLDVDPQIDLFNRPFHSRVGAIDEEPATQMFVTPDPKSIFIGNTRLDIYLKSAGIMVPFVVREVLQTLNWLPFETKYKAGGRPPYSPMCMMGITLLGIMKGVSTLRDLESFARTDLGCMWVSGGISPDHSVLGRFVHTHAEVLTTEFFESLTREVLRRTRSGVQSVAGDGTVIQAAASRYKTVKTEAAMEAAVEARAQAQLHPTNEEAQQKAGNADKVAAIVQQRARASTSKGRDGSKVRISPIEPEAVVQPLKEHLVAPSYKTSILANEKRVIVAIAVDPSSETKVVRQMLDQAERIGDSKVEQVLLDAGYFTHDVLKEALERDLDILCPEGQPQHGAYWNKKSKKKYPKSAFVYDETTNTYRCPAGETLTYRSTRAATATIGKHDTYGTPACPTCPLRSECTKASAGRIIQRSDADELREVQRCVMKHPEARRRFSQRKAMVEPVFGELKHHQGLRRFTRRGLPRVHLEFALHAMAHNLRRAFALAVFLVFWCCRVLRMRTVQF